MPVAGLIGKLSMSIENIEEQVTLAARYKDSGKG